MQQTPRSRLLAFVLCLSLLAIASCRKADQQTEYDAPHLNSHIALKDVTFRSDALARDMQYRVILPAKLAPNQKYPVLYLLHGGGGNFRDWSNYSDIDSLAERGLILVMPEGHSSYYSNAVDPPQDRYEDYITKDLIADVERQFPALSDRSGRAVAGVSMGGFGAIKLALVHPDLFAFAAGLSPALDVPSRPFSLKRIEQWRRFRAIFGPWRGVAQQRNDPLVLVKLVNSSQASYIFLTCGEQEGLLPVNRQFARLLAESHFHFEYHTARGNHDWAQWNSWLPTLSQSLSDHFLAKN